jgi:hypothetical protein
MLTFQSFGFHRPLGTDRESGTRTLLSQTLMKTTRMKLEALGYRFDQEGADLIVNFFIETREVVQGQLRDRHPAIHGKHAACGCGGRRAGSADLGRGINGAATGA